MSRHISGAAVLTVAFFVAAALVIFQVLNSAFGGPSPVRTGPTFEVTAPFADVQGLVTKSLVMVRGVPVGEVRRLRRAGDHLDVTIAVDEDKVTVHRGATMQVGRRTLFGEAYIRLAPGRAASGELASGARLSRSAVLPSVRLDDALKALGPRTRANVRSLNRTGSRVDEGGEARADLNATLGGLAATLEELRALTSELDGQEGDLRRWVSSSRVVVDELGAREGRLRDLVSAGRTSAQAATASVPALRETIAQTGGLLADTRVTLRTVRPLLRRVRPVIERTSAAAPDITRALRSLRPVARSAGTLVRALPAFTAAARPALRRLDQVSPVLMGTLAAVEPALRNVNPVVRSAAAYRRELQGFFNTTTTTRVLTDEGLTRYPTIDDARKARPFSHPGEDAPYAWLRFFVDSRGGSQPQSLTKIGTNPYPKPGALYERWDGTYDRVTPDPLPTP